MAKDKWLKGAVPESHKGIFTAKAKKAGKSVAEFAQEKKHAPGKLGDEALFSARAQKGFKEGGKVEKEVEGIKRELRVHEALPARVAHKGLKAGGHVDMNPDGGSSYGHKCMKKGGMC